MGLRRSEHLLGICHTQAWLIPAQCEDSLGSMMHRDADLDGRCVVEAGRERCMHASTGYGWMDAARARWMRLRPALVRAAAHRRCLADIIQKQYSAPACPCIVLKTMVRTPNAAVFPRQGRSTAAGTWTCPLLHAALSRLGLSRSERLCLSICRARSGRYATRISGS